MGNAAAAPLHDEPPVVTRGVMFAPPEYRRRFLLLAVVNFRKGNRGVSEVALFFCMGTCMTRMRVFLGL
jgi:hypothetical protein